jgi:hypothetical protein
MLVHHNRKTGGQAGTIEDSRGGSALNNAARVRRAVNKMSAAQANAACVDESRRGYYFSVDTSNSNLTPPATSVDWYELKSVDLENMTIEQDSDRMGVPVSFEYMVADNELEVTGEGQGAGCDPETRQVARRYAKS